MQQGRFKANCAAGMGSHCTINLTYYHCLKPLVLVDFLVRHGYLTPDNDPNYMEIMTRLHGRFYHDKWGCT